LILAFDSGAGSGFLIAAVLFTILGIALLLCGIFLLYRPYKRAERILSVLAEGLSVRAADETRMYLSPGEEDVAARLYELLASEETFRGAGKQAQFLAIQNQVNPHFLYNTLEGIRGEALSSGNISIAKMSEALAEFFRYTISTVESLVTLDDELRNVKN
jgi:two-component system sensor histidine kinase YesM